MLIETSAATRYALTGDALRAAHRKKKLAGVLVASPANPTGTMMTPRGARRSHSRRGRGGHPLHLRRDLSRARLRGARRDRAAALRQCGGDQLVLEILLHDRLADRLDGGAADARSRGRPAARQSRDLGADAVADRGRCRLRQAADELEAIKHGYEDNRKILIEGLPKAGLDKFLPVDGAFYLYADVSKFSDDSFAFAKQLLEEAHVAAHAGRRFLI